MSVSTLPNPKNQSDDAIIINALNILSNRIKRPNNFITSVADTKSFLKL